MVPDTFGSPHVRYEKRNGVAWLRLDRPESRNALTKDMWSAIAHACQASDDDPDVQATVITGSGDSFCAGGDMRQSLTRMANQGADFQLRILGSEPGALLQHDPMRAIQRAEKLVISGVSGVAHGAGFILAMVSDLTVASERATFRVPEALRGVIDPWVASRLPLYVGMERAKHILFTCRVFDAHEALAWGFVSEVAPHDELETRVEQLLDRILLTSPGARAAYKAGTNRLLPDQGTDHPDFQDADRLLRSDEAREGLQAFAERRAPAWVPAERAATGRL
jgi:enoyl-CoA hydratase/carnithine racemase